MSDSNGVNREGGNGRDRRGRFTQGNPGGPGNPQIRRLSEYRAAIAEAVSVDDLKAILVKLVEKAKAGDLLACREVLDRVLGKPAPTAAGEPVAVNLPPLRSAADVLSAVDEVFSALRAGKITAGDASIISTAVEVGRRAVETVELEGRIAALEQESEVAR